MATARWSAYKFCQLICRSGQYAIYQCEYWTKSFLKNMQKYIYIQKIEDNELANFICLFIE